MTINRHLFQLVMFFLYKSNELETLEEMQKVYLKYFDSENAEFEILWKN